MSDIKTKYFVYAPSVEAYVYTSDKDNPKMYDISKDIISGSVSRKVDAPSTASLKLASEAYKYDRLFKPMDRIVIYMTKQDRRKVFTGYITSVPLYSVAGAVTIGCECTLALLQRLFWDAGLQASVDEYYKPAEGLGFNTNIDTANANSRDGGMSAAIRNVLTNVAKWNSGDIIIGDIPKELAEYAAEVYTITNSEDEAYKQAMLSLFQMGTTSGTAEDVSGTKTDGIKQEYVTKMTSLANKYGFPLWTFCALISQESGFTPSAENRNSNGSTDYGMCQINTIHRKSSYLPIVKNGKNYFDNNNWKDWQWSMEIGAKYWASKMHDAWSVHGPKGTGKVSTKNSLTHAKIAYYGYNSGSVKGYPKNSQALKNAESFIEKSAKYRSGTTDVTTETSTTKTTSTVTKTSSKKAVMDGRSRAHYKGKWLNPGTNRTKCNAAYGTYKNVQTATVYMNFGANDSENGGKGHKIVVNAKTKKRWAAGIAACNKLRGSDTYKIKSTASGIRKNGSLSTSNHCWALAVDINPYSPNGYDGGRTGANTKSDIPQWMVDGFESVGIYWGGYWHKGSRDPMHFEIGDYDGDGTTKYDLSGSGVTISDSESGTTQQVSAFNTNIWWQSNHGTYYTEISNLLQGARAFVNDVTVYAKIKEFCNSSLRSMASDENGAFKAWYPDKFGISNGDGGIQPTCNIRNIELVNVSSTYSDKSLATHSYCYGSYLDDLAITSSHVNLFTNGIATIDNEYAVELRKNSEAKKKNASNDDVSELLKLFLNIPKGREDEYTPNEIYRRYGLRPSVASPISNATNWSFLPYLYALFDLIGKWQSMYTCQTETTFMPEVMPGMRVNLVDEDIQFYVDEVTHSFDYSSGFRTSMSLSCPTSNTREYFAKNRGGLGADE